MIVSFQTPELHDCCYVAESAEELLGAAHAQALATFIADAEAVETASELLDLFQPTIVIEEDDSLLVQIGSDYQARFVAAGTEFTRDGEGATDWSTVRRVKLLALAPNS